MGGKDGVRRERGRQGRGNEEGGEERVAWGGSAAPSSPKGERMAENKVHILRANFWEGDATKHFSVKKGVFSEKGGGNSVNPAGVW